MSFENSFREIAASHEATDAELRELSHQASPSIPLRSDQEMASGMMMGSQYAGAMHLARLVKDRRALIAKIETLIKEAREHGQIKSELPLGLLAKIRVAVGECPAGVAEALGLSTRDWFYVAERIERLTKPARKSERGEDPRVVAQH